MTHKSEIPVENDAPDAELDAQWEATNRHLWNCGVPIPLSWFKTPPIPETHA
jgi:hypothetical protein